MILFYLQRYCLKYRSSHLNEDTYFFSSFSDDANIDKAVDGCIAAKFRNAGQTCVSVNRIYAQKNVYQEFTSKLTSSMAKLKVGNGFENGTIIGPLINK